MKRIIAAAAIAVFGLGSAHAQTNWSLTEFFRTSDFQPIVNAKEVRELVAQDANGASRASVDDFDRFFVINPTARHIARFNRALVVNGRAVWSGIYGPYSFDNHTISGDIEGGWEKVRAHYSLGPYLTSVAVYGLENNSTVYLVYDYTVPVLNAGCQQYLYKPSTGEISLGFSNVACMMRLHP